jgi:anti-sigma regulatory factor (Ser/Thr protein kinase)
LRLSGAGMGYDKIRIVLCNRLSEIERLRRELENFAQKCDLSPNTLSELNVILEEVVANIISYAYGDAQSHEIVVQADLRDGELILDVEDDGRPFNPLQLPLPELDLPLERRNVGGLGLVLVREFTDSVEYDRLEGKNRLLMRKKIGKNHPGKH